MVRERKYTENDLNNALVEIRRTKNVSLSVIAAKYRIPVATLYFKTHRPTQHSKPKSTKISKKRSQMILNAHNIKNCSVILKKIVINDATIQKLIDEAKNKEHFPDTEHFLSDDLCIEDDNKTIENEITKIILSVGGESSETAHYGISYNETEPTSEAILYITADELNSQDTYLDDNENEQLFEIEPQFDDLNNIEMIDEQTANEEIPAKNSLAKREYKIGEVVFAKVRGYRPWPAKVIAKNSNGSYQLFFFGSKDYANLKDDKIWPYGQYKEKFITKAALKNIYFSDAIKYLNYHYSVI